MVFNIVIKRFIFTPLFIKRKNLTRKNQFFFKMSQSNPNIFLEALLKGDEKTILKIYKEILPKVASFVKNNKGTHNDAQEIFQKALYQLTARIKVRNFEINTSFEAYLFTACKNLWRRELNKQKKEVRNDGLFELVSEDQDNSRAVLEQERWELFEEKITSLSENCKELLKLYFKKTSYKAIVEKFDYANENTAFQRVFKCKKKLADLIKVDKRFQELC